MFNEQAETKNPEDFFRIFISRGGQARTDDPLLPKQVRYQLRYTPIVYLSGELLRRGRRYTLIVYLSRFCCFEESKTER